VIADRPTTRHNHRVRWLVVSLAVHALVVWLLVDQRDEQPTVVLQPPTPAQVETPP
jgi:lipopolysaccharide export system protein LptC